MDIYSVLSDGEIEIKGRLVAASNATLLVSVTHGDDSVDAIYKPISGERPLWDFEDGTLALRERAAFLVSEMCGLDQVPMTILREGPFGVGALQLWIDVDEEIDMALYYRQNTPALRSAALFDAIINNTDRKIGHLLPTKTNELFLCDHGVTFHVEDKLRTVLWQWAGMELTSHETSQVEKLLDSLRSENTELDALLSHQELQALKNRCERLLSTRSFPMPSTDWPAIPWPPF